MMKLGALTTDSIRPKTGTPSGAKVHLLVRSPVSGLSTTTGSASAGEAHGPGMPMQEELAGQWVPKATVVPVSPVLS